MTFEISGLNLERLLREAQRESLSLRHIRRVSPRSLVVTCSPRQQAALLQLCERFGWELNEKETGVFLRALRFAGKRPMLLLGAVLCAMLVALSSRMVLAVKIIGAQEYEAEVQRFLHEKGASVGAFKGTLSLDALRDGLLLRLPGLSYAGLRYAGSVLEIDCRLSKEGEVLKKPGSSLDLIACEPGIVTKLVAEYGTPQVRVGEAVYAGQVLVKGEERTAQGSVVPVQAQAQVLARVWAKGEAKSSLMTVKARETGETRERVTLVSLFYSHVVREAQPFDTQEVETQTQMVIGQYIPLYIRKEVFREIDLLEKPVSRADASSTAQGAAEKLAKKQLPPGALILDKWVDYSMIDNEFIYATVVLEYEKDIAVR